QGVHLRRDVAQVFGEEGQAAEGFAELVKQIVPWTIDPAAVGGTRIGRRNLPELVEAAKVIEPNVIAVAGRPAQPAHPPFVAPGLHHIPAVKRVAPTLTSLAEKIRGHAGDDFGLEVLIQAEQIAVHPDIGAVVVDEDSDVAHNANRTLRAVSPEGLPLLVECELQGAANLQIERQIFASLLEGRRFTACQFRGPVFPAGQFLLRAQGVEENEVVEPPGVLRAKTRKSLAGAGGGGGKESASCLK